MLDAKISSVLNKIIQNSQFKKKVSVKEQSTQKEDRFPACTSFSDVARVRALALLFARE